VDYGALPPEINSARMYAGPGPEPMLAAAAAWDALAAELRAAATSYFTVTSGLATGWQGPSSENMAAAAAPYAAWLATTATRTEHTATQAKTAAAAYENAFAATIPPPVVAANRTQLSTLTATNIFGQNTAAIAANEAQYASMWAQDAAAMYNYAAQSATATQLTPFTPAPNTTTATQTTTEAQNTTAATAANTQSVLTQLTSATPHALHNLAAPSATATQSPLGTLANVLSSLDSSPLETLAGNAELIPQSILPANSALINTIMGIAIGTRARDFAAAAGGGLAPILAAGLGSGATNSGSASLVGAGSTVSAYVGQAGSIAGLAVPQSWAASSPAIKTISAVLSGTAEGSVPAVAMSQSSWVTGAAMAGIAGSALGAALPRAAVGANSKVRGASPKGRAEPKKNDSPQNLERLAAAMTANPESVQHWHTDSENLDDLLAELRKRPGTHAVHVRDVNRKMTPPW